MTSTSARTEPIDLVGAPIVLVGAGRMGQVHAEALEAAGCEVAAAEIDALRDRVCEKAREMLEATGFAETCVPTGTGCEARYRS